MAKKNIPVDQNIIELPLEEAMPDNYLPYAVEVAKDRALPDVRDGLKPVHRRILYGAYLLKAYPDRSFMKSARIVGDIMGKFHPHGDSSVYDAMTILAQDFATRTPLILGQGNWGSMDGDSAAAMRYTEAKLSDAAMGLLEGLGSNTVDFINNYSDTETEPVVLPARFPNLLVNGSFGIAVGLSTNIPSHNLGEVVDAACALIENPTLTTKELMAFVPGPDLPTGGILIGRDSLEAAYETGEGRCVLRAKCSVEKLDNSRWGIVITEFPFRKNKARIMQTISEMTGDKRHQKALEAIADVRDESGRAGVRGVIELKRAATEEDANRVLLYLYKKTDLQSNLSFNMVAIDEGKPKTFGLKGLLKAYVKHQQEVLTRRTKTELETASRRFHIVEGFMHAIDVMDELIKTIRESKNKQDANVNIRHEFGFSEAQAVAILELMLYRLTGLEMDAFIKEHKELEKTIRRLEGILKSPKKLNDLIIKELGEMKARFADERRTVIIDDEQKAAINLDAIKVVEDVIITMSKDGFVKAMALKNYQRSSADPSLIDYREGDRLVSVLPSNTLHTLYIFTNLGNLYHLETAKIVEGRWKDKGERFDETFRGKMKDKEEVVATFSLEKATDAMVFRFFTNKGRVKRTLGKVFESSYTKLVAIKLEPKEEVFKVLLEDGPKALDFGLESALILPGEESSNEGSGEVGPFLNLHTKLGLNFTVADVDVDVKDKMISPEPLAFIPTKDAVDGLTFAKDYTVGNFSLEILSNGEIKQYNTRRKLRGQELIGDAYSTIILFTKKGEAHQIPGYLFENCKENIKLSDFFDFDPKKDAVVGALVVKNPLPMDEQVILATAQGRVKRLLVKEILESASGTSIIKLRSKEDQLVLADPVLKDDESLLLVTKKGMAIRFLAGSVSILGRTAAGVMGISIQEEDEVLWGSLIGNETFLHLKTNTNSQEKLPLEKIRIQNRGGKGTHSMKMVLSEHLDEVSLE